MSDIAIKVEHISKRYRIGMKEELHDTFIGRLSSLISSPYRNYKKLKNLTLYDKNKTTDDIIWAANDVSFEVKRGEVVGLIGRNGAGKTTILKILSRITTPTSGSVLINGRVASLLEVGTGFHGELTGRENVYLNGSILGMKKWEIDKKFDQIVDFSGIEKFIDTPVKRYSSGMSVRLAFSVAAYLEPEILLIDEVLAVGDYGFQKKCLDKMGQITEGGRTIIFVSHQMSAIADLCQRVILIDEGKIKIDDTPERTINRYFKTLESTTWYTKTNQENVKIAYIEKVKFLNSKNKFTDIIFDENIFTIQIKYKVNEEISDFFIRISIADEFESKVLIHARDIDYFNEGAYYNRSPGSYISEVTVPIDTFNIGSYQVTAILQSQSQRNLDIFKCGSFTIINKPKIPRFEANLKIKDKPILHLPLVWNSDK